MAQVICFCFDWPGIKAVPLEKLTHNGRFLPAHQSIGTQEKAFIGKDVEVEQLMMAGGCIVGVEGMGQNGR